MKALSFSEIETVRGRFMLLFHDGGIYEIFFPGTAPPLHCERRPLPWPGLERELQRYLKGQQPAWDDYPLDMSGYPPFTGTCFSGAADSAQETRSYQAAAEAGPPRAWRAAGQALKANAIRRWSLPPGYPQRRAAGRPQRPTG